MNVKLPWKKNKTISQEKLIDDEVCRQLQVMRDSDPKSEEYKQALRIVMNLKKSSEEDKKIKANKKGRVIDIIMTGGLAVLTLTAEQWTPLTSKWWNSVIRQFRGRDI